MTQDFRLVARQLADELLFPDAMRVDGLDTLPSDHLDALAAAGLYGAGAPVEAGGLGLDLPGMCAVTEELASGCLATAFVWIQHFGLLRTLATGVAGSGPPRTEWLTAACQGKLRGGIVLAGLVPGPPLLRAQPAPGGWRLDGTAPWVTGWGLVDVLLVAARGPSDTVVRLIMDAAPAPGLTVRRQRLAAVDASVTVRLGFEGVLVPAERFAGQEPFDPAAGLRPEGLRLNGSLALGVALRCGRLLGRGPLDDELAACRAQLDHAATAGAATAGAGMGGAGTGWAGTAAIEAMAAARAAAAELALRAAAALAVHDGSTSIMTGQHAQRLSREALFLLVFGSRPPIRTALLERLGAAPTGLVQL